MDKLQIIRLLLAGISLICNVWLLVSIIRAEKRRKQYQKERDDELAAIRQSMSELESTLATAYQSLNAAEQELLAVQNEIRQIDPAEYHFSS